MTPVRKLDVPAGFDAAGNPRVASFAAQLADQLRRLKLDTAVLEVRHLEWQPHPGVNTVGMLLAHLAVVDVWWLQLAPRETPEPECDPVMRRVIGISMDDDGLPLAAGGTHPRSLAGRTLADYHAMMDAAREASHRELASWRDAELDRTFMLRERAITREWTAYHVLEHFSAHYGQILLLKHLMRDAGVLPAP